MKKPPPDTEYVVEPFSSTHWRDGFDSRFLRVYWLQGKERVVTIERVQSLVSKSREGSKKQLLITLKEAEKPWAINVTNSDTIAALYGQDPHEWVGQRVTLFPTKTHFGRELVDCIRVKPNKPANGQPPQRPASEPPPAQQPNEPAKAPLSETAKRLLGLMKAAEEVADLEMIEETIVEDDTLSEAETDLLRRALKKRFAQVTGVA